MALNPEAARLVGARAGTAPWKKWGPYLSERQWGTVREDYSADGNPWNYFTHDQARSRAYRWGEDGIAGISDDKQRLCFAVALWNGNDPILKERLFGLTNSEGNHGEDVKEYYFYLDSTPTHSYMKYLYKYPQAAFPYADLVRTNAERTVNDREYELIDTGIFDENGYFDVFVEYIKNTPEDILIQISVCNRGPQAAAIDVLPTLWFRNTWSWYPGTDKPGLKLLPGANGIRCIAATHTELGARYLYCEGDVPLLFTENETNQERIFGKPNPGRYVKDGINNAVVHGETDAVNPLMTGTKVAAHYHVTVSAGNAATFWVRLSDHPPEIMGEPFGDRFVSIVQTRRSEADDFYRSITPEGVGPDAARIIRQSSAGMLWSKQYFGFDVNQWLQEHGSEQATAHAAELRNRDWAHMVSDHIISMPDKWEYPGYAAWDLALQAVALGAVDVSFAKEQLDLMLQELFLHPSGQIPAYEWNFSDVSPPVQAWALLFLHRTEQALRGEADPEFLRRCFQKLMLNFTWWVNRKDRFGKNVFDGGFLGLDHIGLFDQCADLPGGGHLEQNDGTAWMALFCQNMLEIGAELAGFDSSYDGVTANFADHYLWIARAINRAGPDAMWDEEDGFYYDVLRAPDGSVTPLKVRSMVGLLPICATSVIEPWQLRNIPETLRIFSERLRRMPQLFDAIHFPGSGARGVGDREIFALVNPERLRRVLSRVLDEEEFLSPYGIRSLSRHYAEHPHVLHVAGHDYPIGYLPAESDNRMFGGNSNWRGPIWMPLNSLMIRALLSFYLYYGDDFKVECPTGSGQWMNLFEVSREIARRLTRIFLRDQHGRRPVFGGNARFQTDPHWKDYLPFHEYFHGDNGAGLGASHQTGWTGMVGRLIEFFGRIDAATILTGGKRAVFFRGDASPERQREPSGLVK